MAGRLQKKLEKLESDLTELINEEPVETETASRYHQRLNFLKNLVSAEKESHPSSPHHLHHIEQKIAFLESAFQSSSPLHHLQPLPTCSCTHACFKEESGSPDASSQIDDDDNENAEPVFGQDLEETPSGEDLEETLPKIPIQRTEIRMVDATNLVVGRRREEGKAWVCKKSIVVAVGFFALAFGVMAAGFSGGGNYQSMILPPT